MDNILDWNNDMDNNNNDVNVDFNDELSDIKMINEYSTESDNFDKKQNEDILLNFDSAPQNTENDDVKSTSDSNIALQHDMFANCSNDDTLSNFQNDFIESKPPETKVNIKDQTTSDSNIALQHDMFANCSNDDTFSNFQNDFFESKPPETKVNIKDQSTSDSNIALQDNDMFANRSNDDTFGHFKHDLSENKAPETKVNIKDHITSDEGMLKEAHTNVVSVVDDKNKQQNQSKIRQSSFEKNNQTSSGSNCDVCAKTVYPMERVSMDSKIYHKSCFRCCVCQKSLTPSHVSKFKNNIFCKPHYIEKFRKRGKYDDIDIGNTTPDTTTDNKNYIPTNQSTNYQPYQTNETKLGENKEKFVTTKDLTSRFEVLDSSVKEEETFERKEPINIGSQRRVSDAAKAWIENPGGNQILKRGNSNNNNINDSEINHVAKGSVKNLKKLFEAK